MKNIFEKILIKIPQFEVLIRNLYCRFNILNKIIYRAKKDYLPPRLFQFGEIYFLTGTTNSKYIYFYEQVVKNNPIAIVALNLENLY